MHDDSSGDDGSNRLSLRRLRRCVEQRSVFRAAPASVAAKSAARPVLAKYAARQRLTVANETRPVRRAAPALMKVAASPSLQRLGQHVERRLVVAPPSLQRLDQRVEQRARGRDGSLQGGQLSQPLPPHTMHLLKRPGRSHKCSRYWILLVKTVPEVCGTHMLVRIKCSQIAFRAQNFRGGCRPRTPIKMSDVTSSWGP